MGKLFHTGWERKPRSGASSPAVAGGSSPDPNHANAGEAARAPDARAVEGADATTVEMDHANARIVTKVLEQQAPAAAEATKAEEIPEMPKQPALDPLPGADGSRDPVTGEKKEADAAAGP